MRSSRASSKPAARRRSRPKFAWAARAIEITAIEVAQAVESAGAAALTVHGRVAADFFKGTADWNRIAEIKQHLKRIPLIGNGDLDSAEKVVEAFRRYDVDGVMIARASLGRPWLFAQAAAALRGEPIPPEPTLEEQKQCMLWHYELCCRRFGEEKGTLLMRKFGCNYAQGKYGARFFRTHVAKVSSREKFLKSWNSTSRRRPDFDAIVQNPSAKKQRDAATCVTASSRCTAGRPWQSPEPDPVLYLRCALGPSPSKRVPPPSRVVLNSRPLLFVTEQRPATHHVLSSESPEQPRPARPAAVVPHTTSPSKISSPRHTQPRRVR